MALRMDLKWNLLCPEWEICDELVKKQRTRQALAVWDLGGTWEGLLDEADLLSPSEKQAVLGRNS